MKLEIAKRQVNDIYDATTGQVLKGELVQVARKTEMEHFESKGVWTKVPRAEAIKRTGKPPISVKWVDTNKGDDTQHNYRSRLVAREIRRKGEDSIFAPTPPLESLRTILSLTATEDYWSEAIWNAGPESDDRLRRLNENAVARDLALRAFFTIEKAHTETEEKEKQ